MYPLLQAVAGWNPDARQLITRARDESRAYRSNYGEPVPPHTLAERMGGFTHMGCVGWHLLPSAMMGDYRCHNYHPLCCCPSPCLAAAYRPACHCPVPAPCSTVYWYLRPFGASILVAGYDVEAKKHGENGAEAVGGGKLLAACACRLVTGCCRLTNGGGAAHPAFTRCCRAVLRGAHWHGDAVLRHGDREGRAGR